MKLKILFIILSVLTNKYMTMIRTCKPQILRSFDFGGRITPNHHSSLCPRVKLNCCTLHDQMKMHKMWNEVTKAKLENFYENYLENFKKMKQVISLKEEIDLQTLNAKFKKYSKYKPSKKLYEHLKKLASTFSLSDSNFWMESLDEIVKKHLPFIQNRVLELRASVLCGYCNWEYHNFVNIESKTITYHQNFCFKLTDEFLEIMNQKYELFKMFLTMDEWMYLTVDRRLVETATDRAILRRYTQIIARCQLLKGNLQECADFCREFNINKFTYMFDGETHIITQIISNFLDFYKDISHPSTLFKNNLRITRIDFLFFQENHSLTAKKQLADPLSPRLETNDFDLNFVPQGTKSFFEKSHPTNDIQIMSLDDEISSYTLYKRNDNPIDLSRFLILLEPFQGIDLYETAKKVNINLSSDKLLALLHMKGNNENDLNEIMENHVKKVIKDIKIDTIADWMHDNKMDFTQLPANRNYRSEIVQKYKKGLLGGFLAGLLYGKK